MKERKSNFELLRIISMIAIVLFHYVGHGGLAYASLSVNQVLAQFLKIGGKLGVNCFVMISAYFLIDSKFSSKKVVAIAGETTFYALLTVGVKCFFEGCSIQQLVKCFFAPVYDEIYWFPVAYLGLYLIFPFINSWLKANKNAIPKLFWLLTIVFCGIQFFFVNSNYLFSNIAWFIYLYILTALIKLSPNDFLEKWAKYLFMISVALIFLSSLVLKLLGAFLKIHFLEQHMYYFSDMTSPLMLIASVSLFVYMKNLNIPNSRIINYVATLTFPVYLLHDNQYCLDLLYKKVLCASSYYNANTLILILMLILYVISLFAIAGIIEIPRKLLEKLTFKCRIFNSAAKKVDNWFDLQKTDTPAPSNQKS